MGDTTNFYTKVGQSKLRSKKQLPTVILEAWNYCFEVYDEEDNLIFDGFGDSVDVNKLLKPYDLEIFSFIHNRLLRQISTGVVYVADYRIRREIQLPFRFKERGLKWEVIEVENII